MAQRKKLAWPLRSSQLLLAVERLVANDGWVTSRVKAVSRRRRGPQARLYRACHPAILDHRGRRLTPATLLPPPSMRGFTPPVTLTTYSEKTTRENLDARERGDPAWIKCEITCGCVAGAPREGTQSKAATRLLDALVRARVAHQFPRPPYLPGLLASNELSDLVRAVIEELKRNALAAEAAQRRQKALIIQVASELGLNPRPAGHNDSAWIADCPRRSHTIMLLPSLNEFGCGYCRRNGDANELRAFVDYVKTLRRDV